MSSKFNEPWTVPEQTDLLLNVIQGHSPDLVSLLRNVIQDLRIVPSWDVIALPPGRSLRVCERQFQELMGGQRPTHSFSSATGYGTSSFPPIAPPNRSISEHIQYQPVPRAIQPRPSRSTDSPIPPGVNGDSFQIVQARAGGDFGAERRKKRGRPTKEEVEERDRMLAAEGKVYEPKKRPVKKFRASTGTPVPTSDIKMPDSPALTTSLHQTEEVEEEEASPSKRQQIQTTNLPPETSSPTRSGGNGSNMVESPSDRLLHRFPFGDRDPSDRPASRDTRAEQHSEQPAI